MNGPRRIVIILPLVSALLAGCAATGSAPPSQTELNAELLAADMAFAALSSASDPKIAFAEFMAPNAIMLPRRGEAITGYEQAIASFGEEPGFQLLWQPQMAEVAASGDFGWTWGSYQVVVDEQTVSAGKYVNIWHRQSNGQWKVRLDMGNQDPASVIPD